MTRPSHEQTMAAIYDEGAASYAEHWAPALHRHASDLLDAVPAAAPGARRIVVDAAVGAGTLVPELRAVAGPSGRTVVLDRSHGMLTRAPRSVPRLQSDAARLPLADRSVDVLVLAFVLFLVPDAERVAREAARVTAPGGWFLAATWGEQTGTGADALVRQALDDAGAPPPPDLPRSDHLTDSAEAMSRLLGGAGFTEVHTSGRPLDARFDAESALAMRTGCGVLGWRFARLDPAAQGRVLRRLRTELARLDPESLVDRSEVLLTTARRP